MLLFFISCKNEKNEEKENIQKTLKIYLSEKGKEIDSTFVLDSLRIIKIDSVSSKQDLAIRIYKYENQFDSIILATDYIGTKLKLQTEQYNILKYMNSLSASSDDLSIFKNDITEKQNEFKISFSRAEKVKRDLDSLRYLYNSNKIDSTNFLFYNVMLKTCYTNKKMEQKCFDSLIVLVTKNFRVKK